MSMWCERQRKGFLLASPTRTAAAHGFYRDITGALAYPIAARAATTAACEGECGERVATPW